MSNESLGDFLEEHFQSEPMNRYESLLILVLRISAIVVLLAIPTIFLPREWMDWTHRALGLGELPDATVVWYMAKTLPVLYACMGLFTWLMSLDVKRYAAFVTLWGWMHVVSGFVIIVIDIWAGLPNYWTLLEGPPLIGLGLLVIWLQRKVAKDLDPVPATN